MKDKNISTKKLAPGRPCKTINFKSKNKEQ
jgi:hypothetical protein